MNIRTGASWSYLASLPERTARAGAALAGGLLYEASEVILPLALRRSKLYQAIIGRLLRLTIELVGGVKGVFPTEEISSIVALGAVRAGVRLGNVHIFDYYRRALRTIVEEGLLSFLRRTSTPYLTQAGSRFDPRSNTYSERLLRRWADRRSPEGSQATPQAEEEKATRG